MGDEAMAKPIPDFPEFCLNVPLYSSYPFQETDFDKLYNIEFYLGHLDCYCLECKQNSVFQAVELDTPSARSFSHYAKQQNGVLERRFHCSRDDTHELNFYFRFHNKTVTKIGQNPSIADLATYEIRKYTKVLGPNRYAEFSRAVGLISHGIGIGSFVYLRRIIEHLIEESHQKKIKTEGWDEALYQRSRTDERIGILKDTLPEFLVKNKALYSILSKGIHELTEKECLDSFPVIRVGIELILDEKLEDLQRRTKTKLAENEIARLTQKIKGEK